MTEGVSVEQRILPILVVVGQPFEEIDGRLSGKLRDCSTSSVYNNHLDKDNKQEAQDISQ